MPGAPSNAGTTRPESSASAGSALALAAASAFSAALASKVGPVSSGSGKPSSAAPITSTANGASSAAISLRLPGLCVAITRRSTVNFRVMRGPCFSEIGLSRNQFPFAASSRAQRSDPEENNPRGTGLLRRSAPRNDGSDQKVSATNLRAQHVALALDELSDPASRQRQHLGKARLGKGAALGGRLNLDNAARAGEDKIGVRLGARILGIVEVEHRLATNNAAGDRGHGIAEGKRRQRALRHQLLQRKTERHIAAGDGGGTRPAIGLEHVAIDADLPLAQSLEISDRAERSSNEPLD